MSNFSLTPEQLRNLAADWQRHGRAVGALAFGTGLTPTAGSASADALLRCAQAAESAAGAYGGDLNGVGAAVHRFSDLTQTADADAAAGIVAASRR
ncbi:hypothetical protein [Gordonia caeni]|uniref:ESX-1 secretion-associated protein n=1 Tax=Gordonia caeni TaxID=1007097 RepID=A0ABP7PQ74_9ACTN